MRGKPEGVLASDLDGDGRAELLAITRSVVVRGDAPPAGMLYVWSGFDAPPREIPLPDYLLGPEVVEIDGHRFVVCASRTSGELWFLDPLAPDPLATRSRIELGGRPRALGVGPLAGAGTWTVAVATKESELVLFDPERGMRRYPLRESLSTFVRVFEGRVVVGSQANVSVRTYEWTPSGLTDGDRIDLGGIPRAYLEREEGGVHEAWIAGGDRSLWVRRGESLVESTGGAIPVGLAEVADCGVLLLSGSDLAYSFVGQGVSEYAGQDVWAVTAGDLDGDGHDDLGIANHGASRVSVVFGKGDCAFHQGERIPVRRVPHALAAGNLDADERLEVVSLEVYDEHLSVLTDGPRGYEPTWDTATSGGADKLQLADLDGDGHLDAAFLMNIGTAVGLRVAFGTGDGTFANESTLRVGRSKGDILFYPRGTGPPWILVADPDAGQVHVCSPPEGRGAMHVVASVEVPSAPVALARIDADGDGTDEIVCALGGGGPRLGFAVLALAADGTGLEEVDFIDVAPATPLDVVSFDHDGTGTREIALLAKPKRTDGPGVLDVYTRDGGWKRASRQATGQRPFAVAAGDLDADGLDDLAVGAQNSHHVNVWRSRATGLERLPDVGTGRGVLDVQLIDLDGDGDADLVSANGFSNDVSVIRSNTND
ncbi:MAG: hypothetical protein GY711_03425 [bacterium]|nr:hypothetical protein [bacterium]